MYIYGKNPVEAAIESSYATKVLIQRGIKGLDKILQLCKKHSVSVELQDKTRLDTIAQAPHQGVVAKIRKFQYEREENLLNYERILVLDRVQDPHNFGALIRSAYAFKYDCIVIQEKNSVAVTPAVIKVSTGLVFKIPIIMVSNVKYAVDKLLNEFYEVLTADMGGKKLWDINFNDKHCVILGNEGSGVREVLKKRATKVISIPMQSGIDSLNVSVSGAIIMHESYRQLCQKES